MELCRLFEFFKHYIYFLIIALIYYYQYITSVIHIQTYVGIHHGGQHNSYILLLLVLVSKDQYCINCVVLYTIDQK